jgi:hypothetical protein
VTPGEMTDRHDALIGDDTLASPRRRRGDGHAQPQWSTEREIAMNSINGGVGIVGVIIIVLVILFLVGVIKV